MSSKNVNKKYLEKIEEFHKHNKLYYDKNSPTISDEKFDILKKEILDLEKKYNFLESLAEDSFKEIFEDKRINSATIKIEKPDAIKNAKSVGVEFFKSRKDYEGS